MTRTLDYRDSLLKAYPEVYSPAALEALEVLAPLNRDQHELMARRIARRLTRERNRQRIAFLDPQALTAGCSMARTPSGRSIPCRSITSATSSSRSPKTHASCASPKKSAPR